MKSLTLATFVKTPSLTPVKTRLAAGLGRELANEFYALAIVAVEDVMKEAERRGLCQPVWAVAEEEGLDSWCSFRSVAQGEGELGARLHRVYASLWRPGHAVALIGSDAPAMTSDHIAHTSTALADGYEFVMGPAIDGGFYLIAGRKPIPEELWLGVRYSASGTGDQLASALTRLGSVAFLAPLSDVDLVQDLELLASALRALSKPLPSQVAIQAWLSKHI